MCVTESLWRPEKNLQDSILSITRVLGLQQPSGHQAWPLYSLSHLPSSLGMFAINYGYV